MDASTNRSITPARIVALTLITVLLAGLAYLRFGAGEDDVFVPAGAKPGDLKLHSCTYATDNGSYKADCGTLIVQEKKGVPGSKLIALPVTRVRARSGNATEPVFWLEGGPGTTNMEFPHASTFADNHDVVLVGYRGVDGSVRMDCPEVESATKRSTDLLSTASFSSVANAFRACATRLTKEGIDPSQYGLVQQVDDMESARVALGYRTIDLYSESAGTRTALIYGWRFPESIHRSVMNGVNPPGHYLWYPQTTDEQMQHYADYCAKDPSCRARTADLVATMRDTAVPSRWMGLPIKRSNVRIASFLGLMESTTEAGPIGGPMVLDSWLSASKGDASGLWFSSLLGDMLLPKMFVWGQFASAGAEDYPVARQYFSSASDQPNLGHDASSLLWRGGRLADTWPATPVAAQYSRIRTSNIETLLIGGELDFSTPPQITKKELLPYLPNGHQVVLPGFAHTLTFWTEQRDAGGHLINTFLDTGRVDDSHYRPHRVDFTPDTTHTVVGKGTFGLMAALAFVTVLAVAWLMPRRVRRRGGFGPKTGAMLRSVFPILLGLGGWFLGVLIVLATTRNVSIDNQALAFLAVGLPIGLGIYWAWVRRDAVPDANRVGLWASIAGSLVGAWFGYHTASDLMALITAIIGATAVSNLALIITDIRRARSLRGEPGTGPDVVDLTAVTTDPVRAHETS